MALAGVGAVPARAPAVEAGLAGVPLERAAAAAGAVVAGAERGGGTHRGAVAAELVRRAVTQAVGGAMDGR